MHRAACGRRELRQVALVYGCFKTAELGAWIAITTVAYVAGGVNTATLVLVAQLVPATLAALQVDRATVIGAVISTALVALALWLNLWDAAWPTGTLGTALARSLLAMALVLGFCWHWFRRRLGGYTGDTLGASQQLAEVAGLLAWLTVVHPVT